MTSTKQPLDTTDTPQATIPVVHGDPSPVMINEAGQAELDRREAQATDTVRAGDERQSSQADAEQPTQVTETAPKAEQPKAKNPA